MAEYVELYIDQGTDFSTTIYINNDNTNIAQNLSGYVVRSQIRKSILSINASASFVCSVSDPSSGEITLSIDAANTSNISAGTYFYDVKLYGPQNSVLSRLIEGPVFVTPSITR